MTTTLQMVPRPRRGRRRRIKSQSAIGYLRCSTKDQDLAAQRQTILSYATAQGLTVVSWYEDFGVSGGLPIDERPGLLAAIEGLRTDRPSLMLVAKWDRLSRSAMQSALIIQLVEREGVEIKSADGVGNDATPESALMRSMVSAFAEYERALIRTRTKAALRAKSQRGECVGQVPYGYQKTRKGMLVEDPDEQVVIGLIMSLRADGAALSKIISELNARGYPPRGKRWHTTTVDRIIRRNREPATASA